MIGIVRNSIKILTMALLTVHLSGIAQQLAFNKSKQDNQLIFNYSWSDNQEVSRDLSFTLPARQLNRQNHKKFIPELAQQYVYIELHKAARKIDPREARVQIQRRGNDISILVSSRSDKLLQRWQRSMQQSKTKALEQYLRDNYYSQFRSHLGQEGIKPDHLRYIKENQAALLPIAQAVYDKLPSNSETRAYVNLVLSWVQSIPYNELKNRVTSNGAGYLPPLSVVANNHGDCDSKTVLMASLIRSLLPDVKMTMVYLPNHALLGVVLPFRTDEQTLDINGLDYLLMEPTGPAKIPLGEIATSSARDIAGNMYSLEEIL
ncbi:hypothetical protein [uncultured Paraglaciecola sp.]|uniref:hypothetical protein n=1 Tax=uncultured Paraglaciecola sp. TaxID=1765024 RepID=UPI0030D963BF|tara:strand:+ start:63902 stop:64858 length:957 start_codon:yes stop_codon:yes gene_type:complete